jgi:hypothetical protein
VGETETHPETKTERRLMAVISYTNHDNTSVCSIMMYPESEQLAAVRIPDSLVCKNILAPAATEVFHLSPRTLVDCFAGSGVYSRREFPDSLCAENTPAATIFHYFVPAR